MNHGNTNDETTGQMTIIGADTLIKGEMTFQNAARILGKFEGKITSQGQIEIGAGAECKASIEAGIILVDGVIEGDVIAHERLELHSTAIIRGDVTAAKLIAAEGASLEGHCAVGVEAVKAVKNNQSKLTSGLNGTQRKLSVTTNGDLDSLAGLESKLAGFAKAN